MFASRLGDVSLIIVAISTLVASLASAYGTIRNAQSIAGVQKEVKTMNGLTMAQLSDAQETRRVAAIDPQARTEVEQEHLDVVDIPTQVSDPLHIAAEDRP